MTCPFCEKEMESKFLESPSKIFLVDKEHPFLGPQFADERVRLTTFGSTGIPVQYCPGCKKVIFDLRKV